ncbi:6-phosphogluconate dehydrogenase [Mycolicibacterium moriokaense]|uniref:NAD(P)-dependent oxidoreductase n=1 Tax=Mycolicibacterium moriokaense TaxID=39691 RepID=UPI0009F2ECDC|nr:NAD(P)-dependent oxidoreductase [Mycolicibacterium moriokaense]MCV7040789.1 NAD(P)-dependent oxidoreductase [Mycolicibacterium moriokaense]ORB21617.1 6-phosphogluconate dehydrogenase [Mycolicibacterium moriokaense]
MKVGFVGLGNMGAGMAANLVEAGHDVAAYNRSQHKVAVLVQKGARAARTVAEASGGDVVITMLADDAAVEAVTFGVDGIIASLPSGATHVSSSTISVALAERLTDAHAAAGQRFVAAPVFGRPEAAAAAKLFVVAAGEPAAVQALSPVFDAIGQRTFVVGDDPKAASLVKLSGNFLIASVIESLGEAMALVEKAGVDKQEYVELLTSTLFNAPVYKTYGGLMAREEFEPAGFAATLGLKDVRLALAAGESLQVPLPVASLIRDRFLTLLANGGAHLDWSALGKVATWEAGGQKGGGSWGSGGGGVGGK